jgi:hypothetical protein
VAGYQLFGGPWRHGITTKKTLTLIKSFVGEIIFNPKNQKVPNLHITATHSSSVSLISKKIFGNVHNKRLDTLRFFLAKGLSVLLKQGKNSC